MKITARLTGEAFSRYEHGVIALGTLLDVCLKTDLLLAAQYDDTGGWYVRVPGGGGPQTRALTPIAPDLYAFCGEVQDIDIDQDGLDIYYDVLLDCGLPISLLVNDTGAHPEAGDLGKHVPDPGVWLVGIASLIIDWADQETLPVAQGLAATVVGIDRLVLRPGPGFAEVRSEGSLTLTPIEPDRIILTLSIAGD